MFSGVTTSRRTTPRDEDQGPAPDIDERGVDRAQIRRMLASSPAERLAWVQEFWDAIQRLRQLNGTRAVR
jgi:hypothetical protein